MVIFRGSLTAGVIAGSLLLTNLIPEQIRFKRPILHKCGFISTFGKLAATLWWLHYLFINKIFRKWFNHCTWF
jgi:hypothetical protein